MDAVFDKGCLVTLCLGAHHPLVHKLLLGRLLLLGALVRVVDLVHSPVELRRLAQHIVPRRNHHSVRLLHRHLSHAARRRRRAVVVALGQVRLGGGEGLVRSFVT